MSPRAGVLQKNKIKKEKKRKDKKKNKTTFTRAGKL